VCAFDRVDAFCAKDVYTELVKQELEWIAALADPPDCVIQSRSEGCEVICCLTWGRQALI
jgi:hypothetical protein